MERFAHGTLEYLLYTWEDGTLTLLKYTREYQRVQLEMWERKNSASLNIPKIFTHGVPAFGACLNGLGIGWPSLYLTVSEHEYSFMERTGRSNSMEALMYHEKTCLQPIKWIV